MFEKNNNSSSSVYATLEALPKINVHTHLEGTIRPHILTELIKKNHIKMPPNDHIFDDGFIFKNFDHFIEIFTFITQCLKTAEDYELIAYDFGKQCNEQKVIYAEVTFTIETNCAFSGLSWPTILCALNKGRTRAQKEFNVKWQWIFDIRRDHWQTQRTTLEIVKNAKHDGVIALGLSGPEEAAPTEKFVATFDEAERLNIVRTIHAGESGGPESIKDALHLLHANRIGHGVRAIEDPDLVAYLATHRIPLEICPTSNIVLGIYPDFKHHPLRKLWDAGVCITVNDDDPALFNTSMTKEYQLLVDHFCFNQSMLEQLNLNAIEASFLPEEEKQSLRKIIAQQYDFKKNS